VISCLWLVPALPFISAALLILFGSRLPRRAVAALGAGSVGLSALFTALVAASFLLLPATLTRR
jgi:NADH-quinone oxidoreductase subunit L